MGFFSILREDLRQPSVQDPAFNSKIELFFNYPGVWAVVNYRFAHFFYKKGWKRLARAVSGISQMLTNADIHPAAKLGRRVFIDHATGVVIGQTAVIGDDVLIYQGVTLGGTSLERDCKRHPTIENGVIIGAGAKILGDIVVGEGAKVGSNAVVVKNVPANATAVGIPAKICADKSAKEHSRSFDKDSIQSLKHLKDGLLKQLSEEVLGRLNGEILEKLNEKIAEKDEIIKDLQGRISRLEKAKKK